MRNFFFWLLFSSVGFVGCWQSKYVYYSDIIQKPSAQWKEHECRSVIETYTEYNKFEIDPKVRVIATQLNPIVLSAINRLDQKTKGWTEEEYRTSLQEDLHRYLGLTIDPMYHYAAETGKNFQHNERFLDSLVFIVSLLSTQQTLYIGNPSLEGRFFDLKNFQFFEPDLTELKDRIFLENDQRQLLKPNWLGGKEPIRLIRNETFLVMFQLQQPSGHFLSSSNSMVLVIKGFERDIRLKFQLVQQS
jgi:hypothetical protein